MTAPASVSARQGHAVLQPGAWVDVTAREGAMAQVTYDEQDVTLAGWVEAEALGTSATPVALADEKRPVYLTLRPTRLLVRPGGKVLATLTHDNETVVAITSKARGGYRLVEYEPACQQDYLYIGHIRVADIHQPGYGMGAVCGSGSRVIERTFGEFATAPRITIPAGRFLLEPDAPRVVGCVHTPTEVADLGDGRLAVQTIWGPVPVRLAPEDFEGKCGKKR